MEKPDQLTQALTHIGRIEQSVQLGHGGAEATREFAAAEPRPIHSSPRLHRELVNQEVGEVARILVVLQGVVDVHGTLAAGFEDVRDRLAPQLLVDEGLPNAIFRGWCHTRTATATSRHFHWLRAIACLLQLLLPDRDSRLPHDAT
jgi:hypothetical protein